MTDKELGLEDFEHLFTEAEPEELRRYVAAMRDRPAVHPREHGSASAQAVLSRPSGGFSDLPERAGSIDYVTSYPAALRRAAET